MGGGFLYINDLATHNDGTAYYTSFDNDRKDTVNTGEIGLKGRFNTGVVSHDWVVLGNTYHAKEDNATVWDFANQQVTNIYHPIYGNKPALSSSVYRSGGVLGNPELVAKTELNSIAIANTIGMLDDNLKLTLGARYQQIKQKDTVWNTFYDDDKIAPLFALNYRFTPQWSIFANYSQKLTAGKQVAINQANLLTKPYVSKQGEVGVKFDDGNIGATLSAFHIKEPRASLANGTATTLGDNVHQGLEVFIYGAPSDNTRLTTGLTYLDAKQKDTGDAQDGKYVIGTAKIRSAIGAEYDLPTINGLTLIGDVAYTGSRYANANNSLKVDDYALLNLGVRYNTKFGTVPVTFRGAIDNVTNKRHWASVGGYPGQGYLVAGEPRTLKLSATFEF